MSGSASGGVLEFMPKDAYVWPTNFPSAESRITVTGRIKMFTVGSSGQSFLIPRLVEAKIAVPSHPLKLLPPHSEAATLTPFVL